MQFSSDCLEMEVFGKCILQRLVQSAGFPSTISASVSSSGSTFQGINKSPHPEPITMSRPLPIKPVPQPPRRKLASQHHANLPSPAHLHILPFGPSVRAAVHCLLFQLTVCVSCCRAVFSLHSPLAQLEAQVQVALSSAHHILLLIPSVQASPKRCGAPC